jgi:oxalate decarboxylase/phosphoglucose isomerase-like protein (cupin superfamily)
MGVADIHIFEQKAGQVVYIPPGWAHQVENVRDCFKMAFDGFKRQQAPLYLQVWRQFKRILYTQENAATDYASAPVLIFTSAKVLAAEM